MEADPAAGAAPKPKEGVEEAGAGESESAPPKPPTEEAAAGASFEGPVERATLPEETPTSESWARMSSPSSSSSSGSAMLRPAFRDLSPACDDAPLVSAAEGSGVFFAGDSICGGLMGEVEQADAREARAEAEEEPEAPKGEGDEEEGAPKVGKEAVALAPAAEEEGVANGEEDEEEAEEEELDGWKEKAGLGGVEAAAAAPKPKEGVADVVEAAPKPPGLEEAAPKPPELAAAPVDGVKLNEGAEEVEAEAAEEALVIAIPKAGAAAVGFAPPIATAAHAGVSTGFTPCVSHGRAEDAAGAGVGAGFSGVAAPSLLDPPCAAFAHEGVSTVLIPCVSHGRAPAVAAGAAAGLLAGKAGGLDVIDCEGLLST